MTDGDTPGPTAARTNRPLLAASYVCVFLFAVGEGALHVLVPPYLSVQRQLSAGSVGAVVAVFGLASLLARLPVGAAYTPARARVLLVVGGGMSAAAFALVPVLDSTASFAALMAVDGVGWSMSTTIQLVVLVSARSSGSAAAAMGWYAGFQGLGNAVAGGLSGAIADRFGFDVGFLALAALPLVATSVLVLSLPKALPDGAARGHLVGPAQALRQLRGAPVAVWIGVLLMLYINGLNGVVSTFHPLLALGAGLSLTQIGVLASCRSLASSTVRLGSGLLFARLTGVRLTTPLVLLGAGSLALLPAVAGSFALQVPLFLASGVSRGLLRVTGTAEAFDAVADGEHGMTSALLHAGLDLGKLSAPAVGGVVAELAGLEAMFVALPSALLAGYAWLRLVARRQPARTR